jgi:hypothetical protein
MERWGGEAAAVEGAHQRGVKAAVLFEKVKNVSAGLLVAADQFRQELGNRPGSELMKVVDKAPELDLGSRRAAARQVRLDRGGVCA